MYPVGYVYELIFNFQPSIFNLLVDLSTFNLARLFFNIIIMNGGVQQRKIKVTYVFHQCIPLILGATEIYVGKGITIPESTITNARYAVWDNNADE